MTTRPRRFPVLGILALFVLPSSHAANWLVDPSPFKAAIGLSPDQQSLYFRAGALTPHRSALASKIKNDFAFMV
jgi:hypothetical protein